MKNRYRLVMPREAKDSLREIIEYIKSPTAAVKVRKKLLEGAKSLAVFPERFSKEVYSYNNTGNYRSVSQGTIKSCIRLRMIT